jgi:hypothetical protein
MCQNFDRFLDFCENCGYISDSVLGFLRTAVMYKERFVDVLKDGGVSGRIRLFWSL